MKFDMRMLVAASLATSLFNAPVARAQDHGTASEVSGTPDQLIPPASRKAASDFTLRDAEGRPLTLSRYQGKVVLLDFWATWCGGCKVELPWYVEFSRKYRRKGLTVIGVSMDDGGMEAIKPFLSAKHIKYPVVMGDDALGGKFGLKQMPLSLLIDRQGKIAVSHEGVVDRKSFEQNIQELLRDR